jgi:hypothetical protein
MCLSERKFAQLSATLFGAILALVTVDKGLSQTLEESVAFVLSSGDQAALADPKVIGLTVVNKEDCIFRTRHPIAPDAEIEYRFNKVVLDEIRLETSSVVAGMPIPAVRFSGDEEVRCLLYKEGGELDKSFNREGAICKSGTCAHCTKSFTILTNTPERMLQAVQYIYSNFCKGYKRKSAF